MTGSGPTEEQLMRTYPHRRLLTWFAVLTSLALLAGARVGGEATPAQGEASGEIRVVSNWTGSEDEAFQAVIDAFHQKNPKVNVKVEQVPFDQTQALLTQHVAAGAPPGGGAGPARHRPHLRRPGPAAEPGLPVGRLDQGRRLHRRPAPDRLRP